MNTDKIYEFLEKKNYVAVLIIVVLIGIASVWNFSVGVREEKIKSDIEHAAEIRNLYIAFQKREDNIRRESKASIDSVARIERLTGQERLDDALTRLARLEGTAIADNRKAKEMEEKSNRNTKLILAIDNLDKKKKKVE